MSNTFFILPAIAVLYWAAAQVFRQFQADIEAFAITAGNICRYKPR
jgi:hypothetical protein